MVQRDYDAVVRRVEAVSDVDVYALGEVEGLPVLCASAGRGDAPVVYINGGTHGDEPAGVEAALAFLEGGGNAGLIGCVLKLFRVCARGAMFTMRGSMHRRWM